MLKVTNLNDSGSGSLRAAIEANSPRIIVFEVGGTINLASELKIRNPYVTIAGQSAPSPGIMLKGWGIFVATHDVLIQHLRIRIGDQTSGARDCLTLYGPSVYNVVVDHISASWAIDENLSTGGGAHDLTISNSIFSECLSASSYGFLIGQASKNVSLIGNLLANNTARMPRINGDASAAIINNVMYNLGADGAYSQIGYTYGPSLVSMVGNQFIKGPNTASPPAIKVLTTAAPGSKVYLQDNSYTGTLFSNKASFDPLVTSAPLWPAGVTAKEIRLVESAVLSHVGARPLDRDSVDKRIVSEVKSRSGKIPRSQNEVGGWPNRSPTRRSFILPNNPHGDDNGNGYTNIEEILTSMARNLVDHSMPPDKKHR